MLQLDEARRKKELRMANVVFDSATLVIDGKPRRANRIYCYRCAKPGTCVMNSMGGHSADNDTRAPRIAARKFVEMGWSVDLHKGKHFCPECASSQVRTPTHQEEEAMSPTVVPMPRQMSREDRRIVFEKLNEVYLDEKKGYAPPWTDEKVSTDLGVPRAWITNVREEMFGPVGSNSDIDDAVKAAAALVFEMKQHRDLWDKLATQATSIEKRLEQIIKAVRP